MRAGTTFATPHLARTGAGAFGVACAVGACGGSSESATQNPEDATADDGNATDGGDDGSAVSNVGCTGGDCPDATPICCTNIASGAPGSACQADPCSGVLPYFQLCATNADCPVGNACLASSIVPVLKICSSPEGGGLFGLENCAQGGDGLSSCGPSCTESCATSLEVPAGTYFRTYASGVDGGATPADPADVSGFRLDKYDVTVGRFRQFVNAVLPPDGGQGFLPPAGSGRHTHLNGGHGLVDVSASADAGVVYEPGWNAADDPYVAPTNSALTTGCDGTGYVTWTPSVGTQEGLPINCMNWYEAYAFCIWDGAFLPSEAEWEYAAAGGSQDLEYPWGSARPGSAGQYAIYDCLYPTGATNCQGVSNIAVVGSAQTGAGLWGQLDLVGNVSQWTLDFKAPYVNPCIDCAYLGATSARVFRGGSFSSTLPLLLPTYRGSAPASLRLVYFGFRCARTP